MVKLQTSEAHLEASTWATFSILVVLSSLADRNYLVLLFRIISVMALKLFHLRVPTADRPMRYQWVRIALTMNVLVFIIHLLGSAPLPFMLSFFEADYEQKPSMGALLFMDLLFGGYLWHVSERRRR